MENVFYVNNVNVLLKVKESKCISIIMLKLLNISFFRIFKNFNKTKFCVLGDNGEIISTDAMRIIIQ